MSNKNKVKDLFFSITAWNIYKYEKRITNEKYLGKDENGLDTFIWHNKVFHVGKVVY